MGCSCSTPCRKINLEMDSKPAKKVRKTTNCTASTPKKTSVYDFGTGPSTSSDLISNHDLSKINGKKNSILSMICEAIKVVGLPTKGASYIAIQKWIINNRKPPQPKRLRTLIRNAIAKGLETGLLKRSAFSKTAVGVQGYFIINRKHSSEISTQMKSKKKESLKLEISKRKECETDKQIERIANLIKLSILLNS